MKQIFFTVARVQIITALGYALLIGSYVGANPALVSEKKENVKAPEIQKLSEDETTTTEQDKTKSNDDQTEAAKQPAPTPTVNEKENTEQDKTKSNDDQTEAAKQPAPTPTVNEKENTEQDKTKSNDDQTEAAKQPAPTPAVNTEQDKSKQDNTQTKKIQKPELFVNQIPHYHQAKRNGFATFYVTPSYYFYYNDFSLLVHAGLGEVINMPKLIPNGILEGELGFSWLISKDEQVLNLQVKTEINFIKNDGINGLVPGMDIPLSLNINGLGRLFSALSFNVGTGVYLKAFVLKDFALIPRFGINLNLLTAGFGYLKGRGHVVSLELGLGLRRYF